jgi:hypothetical protein
MSDSDEKFILLHITKVIKKRTISKIININKKNNFMENEKIVEQSEQIEEVGSSIGMEPNENINVEMSEEEKARMEEVRGLVEAEKLDPTTSMNIIINAVQVAFETELFNDLDRYLIAKSLNSFKEYVERGEDIVLKVK